MSLGKRILQLRLESNMTQRDVSKLTGIAVSYLSRLENDWVVPTVRTLNKISDALQAPLPSFFDSEPVLESGDRCPVSLSGRCILDQLHVGRGRRPKIAVESYSPQQLEVLRLCNFLLHTGERDILTTLSTIMESLARVTGSAAGSKPRRSLRPSSQQSFPSRAGRRSDDKSNQGEVTEPEELESFAPEFPR
ncbi:MAG: helix-turn-helix domain-containing protein [Acidobacteriota bacterium]